MKISIIIPVYNESATLVPLLEKIDSVNIPNVVKEIIIVDDGSIDHTKQIIKSKIRAKNLAVFVHDKKRGKGEAIKTGLKACSGDLVLIQDADMEYDPRDYQKMISFFLSKKADVVYGVRFKGGETHCKIIYRIANKFLTRLTNFLYGSSLTDMETCYKLFKREILLDMHLESKGFEFEPEVTAKLLLKNIKIHEVPISYCARDIKSGKKIRFIDGFIAVYVLLKYRFKRN